MKRFLTLCSAGLFALALCANVITYTADDVTIFRNPERGFTEELSRIVTESKNHVIKGEEDFFDEGGVRPTETLTMVLYNFNQYKTIPLSDKILKGFDEDMQVLRDKGFKCVLRFAYTEDEDDPVDAAPDTVQLHLQQLKPYLEKNKDVIYTVEAGFVGVWGEWYYTTHYENESQHMNAARMQVVEALFANVPTDRFVLFRYPMLKTEYFKSSTPLSASEAFTGTMKARWGCHNDAFLNDWGNDGTYASDDKDDDPAVRQFIADETLYVPNGGETNVEKSSLAEKVYTKAEDEMSKYHWSFCGESYAKAVTSRWKQSGIFDNLNRKMGYRYQLTTATIPSAANPDTEVRVVIKIKNVGYAPLYNERHAYIVLSNQQSAFSIQLASDPRRWLPNGVLTTIDENITIPADIPNGTYQVYLHMPDIAESLAADPRYAVRFANVDTWDAATGMNKLNTTLEITGSTVIPDPDPEPDPDPDPDPEPEPTTGHYTIRTYNTDSTQCTWSFKNVVTSEQKITEEVIDNDLLLKPGSGNTMKVLSDGLSTQKTQNSVYIPVPAGSEGTISMEVFSTSDSRWFQLYINGMEGAENQRLWSKEGDGTDGKRGPRSFAFTADDITTYKGKTYLALTDNGTEMKVVSFTVSLTVGTYAKGTGIITAVEQTQTVPQVDKILRDGQLLIRKNGKLYTVQGTELF